MFFRLSKLRWPHLQSLRRSYPIHEISAQKHPFPPRIMRLVPLPKYGGEHFVTMLTGSTLIGQQGASYIRTLFETAKVPVAFERIIVDDMTKATVDDEFVKSVARNRAAIQVDLQHDPKEKHKSMLLNAALDLYACVIKMHSFAGFNCKYPDLDILLIIENNSGDFTKLEYDPVPGHVETLKFSQDTTMRRYLRFVFEHAVRSCRKKITFAHHVTELPKTDGMFLKLATEMQCKHYSQIEIEFMAVNKMARYLVMYPQCFDMICTSDRYGTFIASICSAVCGGASLFSATEIGDNHAVFKPLQTKLSYTESRSLSPYGVVRACVDLLVHLGNTECAHVLWAEMLETMLKRGIKTKEFGGSDSGDFVICSIVNNLRCKFA